VKEYLKQILRSVGDPILGRCLAREYLQARLLQSLQDHGVFNTWAFQGGTALRFLYSMPRFSEDLDFALIEPAPAEDFRDHVAYAKNSFEAEGYDAAARINDKKAVKSAFLNFKGLPFELGLSPHSSETFSIKLEVDSNPPAGAHIVSTIVRRHVILNLRHHDRASLLAGKLHALLARPYTKGRDVYDLVWYLSDRTWPEPNIELLNNALKQTGWSGPEIAVENWRELVLQRIEEFSWEQIRRDVKPFLERSEDAALLTKENVSSLLQR
jgi:predicted nucleotidyltransferase component of viral defense system